MIEMNGNVLNRAVVESFAGSASRLSEENEDTRILKLRDFSISIDRIRANNTPIAYAASVFDNKDVCHIIDSQILGTPAEVENFVMAAVTKKYSLSGVSIKDLRKAVDNIVLIKMYLYLRAFFENDCNDGYRTDERSIIDYDFVLGDITTDNVLEVTTAVLNDIREKTRACFSGVSEDDLEEVGLDYEDFEEEVFSSRPSFPEWDVYGPHRLYMNEVELPPICEKLLDTIGDLYFNEPDDYEVSSYDLSEYIFGCSSNEQLDMICGLFDCYTVFQGDEELYSV